MGRHRLESPAPSFLAASHFFFFIYKDYTSSSQLSLVIYQPIPIDLRLAFVFAGHRSMATTICRKRSSRLEDPLDVAGVVHHYYKRVRLSSPPRPSSPPASASPVPQLEANWVARIVNGLSGACTVDDAASRTSSVLREFEAAVEARIVAEAAEALAKEKLAMEGEIRAMAMEKGRCQEEAGKVFEEAVKLKEQVDGLVRDNGLLKKAVLVLNERVQKQEPENYTLRAHLNQALQGSSGFRPPRFDDHVF